MWPESRLERRVSSKTQALAYSLKLVLNHRTDWGTERRFRCPGFAETSSGLSDSSEARYLIQDIVDWEAAQADAPPDVPAPRTGPGD